MFIRIRIVNLELRFPAVVRLKIEVLFCEII